jgi:hypothetical protein
VKVITPESAKGEPLDRPWLFCAGGITGCSNWQEDFAFLLGDVPGTMFNPRRENFDVTDPAAADVQIEWEFRALAEADAISFWFCHETLCPIVLFELGKWCGRHDKPIAVGCEPGYQRLPDVIKQLGLERPDVFVMLTLDGLARETLHVLEAL